MPFPAIKAMLCLFSLLALLSFSTAAPAPNDKTLHTAPLDTRQESNGIYYGDLCNPKDPIAVWFPKECWLGLYQKENTSDFWTGEGRWVSMDSQLKYTVDVQTVNQVPRFNYAGRVDDC
ncbi:hypothetical protein V8E51_005052 [Hyaloscypha variabilis]